jgi:hypothetical protein
VPCYAALSALVLNIVVSVLFSILFNAIERKPAADTTLASDYV